MEDTILICQVRDPARSDQWGEWRQSIAFLSIGPLMRKNDWLELYAKDIDGIEIRYKFVPLNEWEADHGPR